MVLLKRSRSRSTSLNVGLTQAEYFFLESLWKLSNLHSLMRKLRSSGFSEWFAHFFSSIRLTCRVHYLAAHDDKKSKCIAQVKTILICVSKSTFTHRIVKKNTFYSRQLFRNPPQTFSLSTVLCWSCLPVMAAWRHLYFVFCLPQFRKKKWTFLLIVFK